MWSRIQIALFGSAASLKCCLVSALSPEAPLCTFAAPLPYIGPRQGAVYQRPTREGDAQPRLRCPLDGILWKGRGEGEGTNWEGERTNWEGDGECEIRKGEEEGRWQIGLGEGKGEGDKLRGT